MKKLLGIVVLGLLWCNVGFAHCSKGNCINGYGTFTFESGESAGDEYVGEFKEGLFNGQGTYTHANGGKYVGEWKEGKYNGQGTYIFVNGDEYVGEYKDGEKNGQGTYTFSDGRINKGIWKNEKLVEPN